MPENPVHENKVPRDRVGHNTGVMLQFIPDLVDQRLCQHFVCIDAEHPVILCFGNSVNLLLTKTIKCPAENRTSEFLADLNCFVGAITVYDNDLVAPPELVQR